MILNRFWNKNIHFILFYQLSKNESLNNFNEIKRQEKGELALDFTSQHIG